VYTPQTPPFWGTNRHCQAKLVKYQHLHVIESTAPIQTKFCTVVNTAKYSSWVVKMLITNARWRTAAIVKKIEKLPYFRNGLTYCPKILHNDRHRLSELYIQLKVPVLKKSKMADSRHFEKPLNRRNSAMI